MAIDETGLTKGQVRKLNALRKSVGDDLAEEVFAKWLERAAASSAKSKPDPVAMKIVEALAGFENDPKFKLGNYGYTLWTLLTKVETSCDRILIAGGANVEAEWEQGPAV